MTMEPSVAVVTSAACDTYVGTVEYIVEELEDRKVRYPIDLPPRLTGVIRPAEYKELALELERLDREYLIPSWYCLVLFVFICKGLLLLLLLLLEMVVHVERRRARKETCDYVDDGGWLVVFDIVLWRWSCQ